MAASRPVLQRSRSRWRRSEAAAVCAALALTVAAYLATLVAVCPSIATRQPQGIYPLLTDALLSGQLHLKVEPDPRLVALADPYAGNQGIPRIHDATLYHGHYYSYFGITPVLLLMGPWRLLTNSYLTEGAATLIFSFAGFLIGSALWIAAKRRFFPGHSAAWLGFGVLLLGIGNYWVLLIQTPEVYEVPISCAYACLMAAVSFLAWAVTAQNPRRQASALALASLAWGLAVGARPNYAPSVFAFALPACFLWLHSGRKEGFGAAPTLRVLAAAAGPVALVGLGLAGYNWARFGNPLEFGIRYQLTAIDQRHMELVGFRYFLAGLRSYLISPPVYSPYFPFVAQSGSAFGIIFWAPLALAALGFPLTLRDPGLRRDPAWALVVGAALLAAAINFGVLCTFWGGGLVRYEMDFLPLTLGVGLLVASKVRAKSEVKPARKALAVALAGAAIWTLGHSALLAVASRSRQLPRAARVLDFPAYWAEKFFGAKEGPVVMRVIFPAPFAGPDQPLVATGGGRDILYLRHPGGGYVQFGYFHEGLGGPLGRPLKIDPGSAHSLSIDLGSLYPPSESPFFDGWPQDARAALKRRLLVRLDGRTVLQASVPFYPNDPLHTFIGRNPLDDHIPKAIFTGRIISVERGGMPRTSEISPIWNGGAVRLTLRFPPYRYSYGEPLVSTGPRGEGDLVYVTYLGPGRVRFGHDSASHGAMETGAVRCDPDAVHVVDIDLGSLHPGTAQGAGYPFQLRFDGKLLVSAPRPFNPASVLQTAFGFNASASTAAAVEFTGPQLDIAPLALFRRPAPVRAGNGPMRLVARLPARYDGLSEPLLETGRSGAGDVIYLTYVDRSHIRIGHDHWGSGGPVSAPVAMDFNEPHEFVIGMHPCPTVSVDGRLVLRSTVGPYRVAPGEIFTGSNPIGASTCEPWFTGQILLAEPLGSR